MGRKADIVRLPQSEIEGREYASDKPFDCRKLSLCCKDVPDIPSSAYISTRIQLALLLTISS